MRNVARTYLDPKQCQDNETIQTIANLLQHECWVDAGDTDLAEFPPSSDP